MMPWKLIEDPNGYIFIWLGGIGTLLGPVTGVLIADYFVLRRTRLDLNALYRFEGAYTYVRGVNPAAVVAFGLGVAPSLPGFFATATGANVPADGGAFRNTVSIDQLIAEVQGPFTRFASLELAIEGHSLAWSRDGIQLPAERHSRQIFNLLCGVDKESKPVIQRRLGRRGSILDLVAEDAQRVNRKLGSHDRSKLDEYLTAVRQVEVRTERAVSWLDTPKPAIDPADEARLTRPVDLARVREYHGLFADLMVLALKTDSTRVITCSICGEAQGLSIPDIGISSGRHSLSHHDGDPEQMRRFADTDAFLVEQFASFLDRLAGCEEHGRPLLDSTQVLWGSGMCYGQSHGNANLPTILAGGRALGYRHGQHVDFNLPAIGRYPLDDATALYRICSRPVDENARLSNLLVTMAQRAGVESDTFQDSTGTVSQVLGET
jgi:hypothetical protein